MSFYDLRLNDLAAFNTAFEQESISKAAEMLYTTRQSVARSIDRVESMTGIQLFERTPMGIIPNIQGSRVYEISKTVVNEARKFDRVGISGNETITVGVMGKYQTGCLIEDLLEEYSEEKENLKIEVSQHDWPGILGKVEKHELMFAYVGLVDEYIPKTLETAAMRKNCLYAIAAKEEAAFCGGRFPAQLLDGKNILLHSRYNIQLGILRRYAEENGIKLRSCQTTSDIFLIAECLEKPDYRAILLEKPAEMAMAVKPGYVRIPMSPELFSNSGLVYRKSMKLTKQHRDIIRFLKRRLNN